MEVKTMPNENYLCGIPSGIYKCGGIAPVPATDDMTQPVGQKNGLLFTTPPDSFVPDPTDGSDGDILVVSSGEYVLQEPGEYLPTVTADDNDKILRVVSGAWAAVLIPDAEGVNF